MEEEHKKEEKPETPEITLANIRKICEKKGSKVSWFRRISYYMAIPILHTSLTPTGATVIWLVLALISLPFFYFGDYWLTLAGALLLSFAFIFDNMDGNIARFKQHFSDRGYFLDEIGTYVIIPGMVMFLGIGGFRSTGQIAWVWIGGLCMFVYLNYHILQLISKEKKMKGVEMNKAAEHKPKVHSKYMILAKIFNVHVTIIFYMLIIFSIFGVGHWMLIFFLLGYGGQWAGKTVYDYFFTYKN